MNHLKAEKNFAELVDAIELRQYHLLSQKDDSLRRSSRELERTENDDLLDELNRCLLKKLGVMESQSGEEGPEEFREDHSVTSWARGSKLKTAEDIIACWYLSNAFPWGLDFKQMTQIQQKLKEQMQTLEAEEAEYEDLNALELWRFRRDIKAEQLEQIQDMMWNYTLDEEVWSLEE